MQQHLAQHDATLGGRATRCIVKGPVAVRDYSVLFYADSDAFPSEALIKVCVDQTTGRPDGPAAQRQYRALAKVHEAMAWASGFSVPQPYLIRSELGLLAMEWVRGANVAKRAFSWLSSISNSEKCVARSAAWLRAFHASGRLPPSHLDVHVRLPVLEEMTRRALPNDAYHAALAQLRRSADAAAAIALPRAWIHGDFTADNVILSGAQTIGIDMHLEHENAVVYDLASFLNNLALSLYEPRGWRLGRSHERLRDTFLSTYFQGDAGQMEMPVAWVQLYMAVQQWRSARQHAGHTLRGHLVDWQFQRLTLYLVRRLASVGPANRNSGFHGQVAEQHAEGDTSQSHLRSPERPQTGDSGG